ncbi:beta-1,4-glucuronyltransferase 1-like [Uloborus diversus]|uniref:beta-1,4-glucuronyltransferase 1-like n=1 Tax=Uloborus diversus TaxID=327109 RepID=UPI00240A3849|nr:beta-1,4-glucuronyltransferase 1-like [Uloborus diversus]
MYYATMMMQALWKKAVIFLVIIIAILQVIHMTLLSRLEARKNQRHQREVTARGWESKHQDYRETEIERDRSSMMQAIRQSSVLDSSGEFHIINYLITSELIKSHSHVKPDLTLATQTTINGLHNLNLLASSWQGSISIAVFSLTEDVPLAVETILHLRRCYQAIHYNTSFHLVYPLNGPTNNALPSSFPNVNSCDFLVNNLQKLSFGKNYALGVAYPNNLLRNVARRSVLTEFVFMIDIDMVPSENIHKDFLQFAREKKLFSDSNKDDKTVYVVPAFEVKEDATVPRHKAALLQQVEAMVARPFYFELCWKCQKHTDYEAWQRELPSKRLDVLFEVLWRDPWEPFYIGRNNVPLYDERFRQYGFNRISQVCELHVAGYKFSVLNNAFVVHRGLKTANSFHKDKEVDQERNRVLFRQFKAELKEKYPDSSRKCY